MSRLYPGWGSGKHPFEATFQVHSLACMGRDDMEGGDKVILPQTAFKQVSRLRLPFPLTFEVQNPRRKCNTPGTRANVKHKNKAVKTRGDKNNSPAKNKEKGQQHCGVMEFSAPEGQTFLPFWMMQNLRLKEGSKVFMKTISSDQIPKGVFCRLQPHTSDFLDLAAGMNIRDLLEAAFRNFSVLSTGVTIMVTIFGKKYYLNVLETKPALNISLYGNLDLEVDFAAPLDTTMGKIRPDSSEKKKYNNTNSDSGVSSMQAHQIPINTSTGTLNIPNQKPSPKSETENPKNEQQHFWGVGQKLSNGELTGNEETPLNTPDNTDTNTSTSISSDTVATTKFAQGPKIKKFARKTDTSFGGSGNTLSKEFSKISMDDTTKSTEADNLTENGKTGRTLGQGTITGENECKPTPDELRQRRLQFYNISRVRSKQLEDESRIASGSSLDAIRKTKEQH